MSPPTLAMLSAILADEPPARPVCTANRRDNRGRVVVRCSFPSGHEGDHRDVHAGATWT